MTIAAIAILGLVAGLTIGGCAVAVARRRPPDDSGLGYQVQLQASELRRIADQGAQRDLAAEQLRQGLEGARRALEELRTHEQDRRAADGEQREIVRRLATVLAGGASKGRAGEYILREHLAELPPGMLVTDFRVNGKVVEFGLLLPDGRRLPIDSKWTAVAELEALGLARDPTERDACARAVERAVTARAKEVAQYLDPAVTAPVAVAAVPDAAYRVLKRAHAEAYAKGIIIVPYGSALPIVLFLYALVRRFGDAADVQAGLSEVAAVLDALESIVENRFQKAATMLTNGTDEFRSQLSKARGSIARAEGPATGADGGAGEGGPPLTIVG
ncbi:MAG: DNA recombination protein RmuC [Actinobacteria bacterium]|nr:MAG: DNA recombination protein RmuC [Actinomycetota bacterium]